MNVCATNKYVVCLIIPHTDINYLFLLLYVGNLKDTLCLLKSASMEIEFFVNYYRNYFLSSSIVIEQNCHHSIIQKLTLLQYIFSMLCFSHSACKLAYKQSFRLYSIIFVLLFICSMFANFRFKRIYLDLVYKQLRFCVN